MPIQPKKAIAKRASVAPTTMGSLVLDLSEVAGFEPLPAGAYVATISKWEVGTSKALKPKLEINLVVDKPREMQGRKLFDNPSLQQQAAFRVKQVLTALGEEVEGRVTISTGQHVGEQVGVIVVQREYNGEMRNNIARYVTPEQATEALSV